MSMRFVAALGDIICAPVWPYVPRLAPAVCREAEVASCDWKTGVCFRQGDWKKFRFCVQRTYFALQTWYVWRGPETCLTKAVALWRLHKDWNFLDAHEKILWKEVWKPGEFPQRLTKPRKMPFGHIWAVNGCVWLFPVRITYDGFSKCLFPIWLKLLVLLRAASCLVFKMVIPKMLHFVRLLLKIIKIPQFLLAPSHFHSLSLVLEELTSFICFKRNFVDFVHSIGRLTKSCWIGKSKGESLHAQRTWHLLTHIVYPLRTLATVWPKQFLVIFASGLLAGS